MRAALSRLTRPRIASDPVGVVEAAARAATELTVDT
jgi:hypothetical protein